MSCTDKNQSAIREVRDQISLDYADGEYLGRVSSNLGIRRPTVFGFKDDRWRALVKELALEYKQVVTKFHDVMAVLFGPQITEVTSLSSDLAANSLILFVNDASRFPQLGFVVLDEGTASEETIEYCFVDYANNAIYLEEGLQFAHAASDQDAEGALIVASGTDLYLPNTVFFPTSYPYVVVVGRGTPAEESAVVVANDQFEGKLTLSGPLSNTHAVAYPVPIRTTLSQDYTSTSVYISLTDSTQFPDLGLILFDKSSNSFTATGGSSTTVDVAASTFTTDKQIRHRVVFTGNVTAALADVEATVVDNTDAQLTFSAALPASPAAGDTFYVRAVAEFTSHDYENKVLGLKQEIYDITLPALTQLELLTAGSTVSLATVQVKGVGWDVIQARPRELELYIPSLLQDEGNLRSASYLHTTYDALVPSTTLSSGVSATDTVLPVTDSSIFPLVGVVTVDPGGGNEEVHGYYVSGTDLVLPTTSLVNSHLSGVTVELYQPRYGSTELLDGNVWTTPDVFPGPYAYELGTPAPTPSIAQVTLEELLPGPTSTVLDSFVGHTALEVEDASAFELSSFPYSVLIGDHTGNRETIEVTDANLKQRVGTTVSGVVSPGDTAISVASLSGGPAGDGADFPNAWGYRVLLDRDGVNEEVVYVTAASGGVLTLEMGTVNGHSIGETVELMADVLTLSSAFIDDHNGRISYDQRSTATSSQARWPVFSSTQVLHAETVQPLITSIDLLSASGLDVTGGRVWLNFGSSKTRVEEALTGSASAGATVLSFADTSMFPTSYPYVVVISKGFSVEEKAVVTNNNTTLNELTINGGTYGLAHDHAAGREVAWYPGSPEVLDYTSVVGNSIRFSPPIVLESTHSPKEWVIDSSEDSDPTALGWDFPLRLPPDIMTRIRYILDLVRAAGVRVSVISAR